MYEQHLRHPKRSKKYLFNPPGLNADDPLQSG